MTPLTLIAIEKNRSKKLQMRVSFPLLPLPLSMVRQHGSTDSNQFQLIQSFFSLVLLDSTKLLPFPNVKSKTKKREIIIHQFGSRLSESDKESTDPMTLYLSV